MEEEEVVRRENEKSTLVPRSGSGGCTTKPRGGSPWTAADSAWPDRAEDVGAPYLAGIDGARPSVRKRSSTTVRRAPARLNLFVRSLAGGQLYLAVSGASGGCGAF